jgi:hypothetical protein
VGTGNRVRVGLRAPELADVPGARLVQVVDDRDRELQQDLKYGAVLLGEFSSRRGDPGRGHDQDDGLLDRGPDRCGGIDRTAAGERDQRGAIEDPPPITRRRPGQAVPVTTLRRWVT